jgi:predicted alpha/beta-fold hydrolase
LVTMEYKPPFLLRGAHLETLFPHFFRRVKQRAFEPLVIHTPDDDFLEADYYNSNSKALVIISHGLEGDSRRDYIIGMSNIFLDHQYDVLTWNYRGCGQNMNNQPRLYHSGATDDLDVVVKKGISLGYEKILLIGFSLGGNLTLKYVGERGNKISHKLKAIVAFSTPLDLAAGCDQLSKAENFLYSYRFISKLKQKARLKHRQFPDLIKIEGMEKIKDLRSFDDRFTAPLHGFKDASDYYEKCSSIGYLDEISVPTLIVNAKNDPFLPEQCYPTLSLSKHSYITFEAPDHGGHVGFSQINKSNTYWSEQRAIDFAEKTLEWN